MGKIISTRTHLLDGQIKHQKVVVIKPNYFVQELGLIQPETLEKLISELLLFSRFFLNFPRPYIPIEWANFLGGRMFGHQLCGGEK